MTGREVDFTRADRAGLSRTGLEGRNMLSHDEAVAQPGGSSLATGWAVPSPKKRPRELRNAGAAGEAEMGSVNSSQEAGLRPQDAHRPQPILPGRLLERAARRLGAGTPGSGAGLGRLGEKSGRVSRGQGRPLSPPGRSSLNRRASRRFRMHRLCREAGPKPERMNPLTHFVRGCSVEGPEGPHRHQARSDQQDKHA